RQLPHVLEVDFTRQGEVFRVGGRVGRLDQSDGFRRLRRAAAREQCRDDDDQTTAHSGVSVTEIWYEIRMLSVEEAAKAVAAKIAKLPIERIAIQEARSRILAENIVATNFLPPFDNSAMDGFAARSKELPATLPVVA